MTAMERSRICVGPLIFCVNAMTNSQNWKPRHRKSIFGNLNRRYRYRCGLLEYYAGLIPALEGSQIPLRRRHLFIPAANRWAWWRGLAQELPDPDCPVEIRPGTGGRQPMIFKPSEVTPLTALKLAEITAKRACRTAYLTCCRGWARSRAISDRASGHCQSVIYRRCPSGKKVMANSAASSLKEVTMNWAVNHR